MSTRRTYTYKDNPELCKKLQDGDNNAAELICCVNMSLARKCADNAARIYGQDWDWRNDFLQEALIGILEAAGKYNAELGAFSTYAMWYINQHIRRFASQNRYNVRIPIDADQLINQIDKLDGELQELPLNQRIQKIAEKLDLSPKKVETLLCIRYQFRHTNSLNVPIKEDEELTLLETVPDTDADAFDVLMDQVMAKNVSDQLWKYLSERETQVIRWRFGIEDGHCYTLAELGKKFGVGQERIRQIEAKAIRKLKGHVKAYADIDDLSAIAATY